MSVKITRRRFVEIAAAAALLPSTATAAMPAYRWRGFALGAVASMTLVGVDEARGAEIASRIEAEIERLEKIFSLYRPDSSIRMLNRQGVLETPPADLLTLLSICSSLHERTAGAFDPTVQPLWALHARAAAEGRAASPGEIAAILHSIGWESVAFDERRIAFSRPDMAITLNGIAQGYITDRIADRLRAEGLTDVLVHLGETRALGHRPDGGAWRASITDPAGNVLREVALAGRSLATSAPSGTMIDRQRQVGHILDPVTGMAATRWRLASVSAPHAAIADGLSTAFCMMAKGDIDRAVDRSDGVTIETLV